MAKILISPLGVGPMNTKEQAFREYIPATYRIDEREYEKSFIASVLYEHLELDGIIFIGTIKSMWEEVYRSFCEEKEFSFDENYYFQLAETIDHSGYESNPDSIDLFPLEQILGQKSKCIPIYYGLNQKEIQDNLQRILQIVEILEQDDEIYIDITHSLRSLSLFLFLVLTFLKDLVSEKNIKISGVYYGMLDVRKELGYAPIVDLKSLFELTQWIKGAYSFKNFGNGYLIAELLQKEGDRNLSQEIIRLSDTLNLNYIPSIKQQSATLKNHLKQQDTNSHMFPYVSDSLEEFVDRLTGTSGSNYQLQLELAGWFFENKRYATGYITLSEAIITYACEVVFHKDPNNKDERSNVQYYFYKNRCNQELPKLFIKKINPIRNAIAHASFDKKRPKDSYAINKAMEYYKIVKRIVDTGGLG